jgi:hypothetical protein
MSFVMRRRRSVRVCAALGATIAIVLMSTAKPALAAGTPNTAGPPTLTHSVKPTYTAGNITSCPKGTTTFINTSGLSPGDQSVSYSHNGTTFQAIVNSKGTFLSFMTNSPSFTVYIKGGAAYDTYNYTGTTAHPAYPSDTGLHSPYNSGGNLAIISHYLVCGQPATGMASPKLTTAPSAGGMVGSVVLNDTGTLSGGASPTGSITFNLYDPSHAGCSGTPAYTQTVPVLGDGSYSTSNTTAANVAGTWSWTAIYTGDANNFGASSACGQETVPVAQASPSLTTTPSPGGTENAVVLNDTGTVSGGYLPGGSITFNLYDPSHTDCSGTPAYTQTVPVLGNGSYSTSNTTAANVAGTWSWTATYTGDSNNNGAASTCTKETATVTPVVAQGSCEGSGSISALVSGTDVISYVPKGNWGSGATGIDVVNVEGSSITNTQIPTGSDAINSCASNSVTGQTVCTANNNDVYVLKGTGLDPSVSPNPLTDGGSGTITFSGGSATTTGVSMDATDNKALLALSVGGVGGFQFLNLATDTFEPAFTTQDSTGQISEDPLIDPVHHLIVSAAEDNNYELTDVSTSTAPKFFEHPVPSVSGSLDSSAEDCSTGIILAPAEFSSPSQVEIADISNPGTAPNAVFTPGTPGSWTAPEQVQTLAGSSLSAGASGSAVAQGTHTGVIAGEFGGDSLTALALPATSGTGAVPAISNWVSCETGPDPSGNPFSMGLDPHTLAAYQSPNGGDAIALMVNDGATQMVRVDLTDMLNPAIVPATGNVCNSATLPSSAETFIPLP